MSERKREREREREEVNKEDMHKGQDWAACRTYGDYMKEFDGG